MSNFLGALLARSRGVAAGELRPLPKARFEPEAATGMEADPAGQEALADADVSHAFEPLRAVSRAAAGSPVERAADVSQGGAAQRPARDETRAEVRSWQPGSDDLAAPGPGMPPPPPDGAGGRAPKAAEAQAPGRSRHDAGGDARGGQVSGTRGAAPPANAVGRTVRVAMRAFAAAGSDPAAEPSAPDTRAAVGAARTAEGSGADPTVVPRGVAKPAPITPLSAPVEARIPSPDLDRRSQAAAASPPAAPVVRVSIGRIEVRAAPPPARPSAPASAPARSRGPSLTLGDYLAQRADGRR